jgi:phage gp46-like protein
VRCVVGADTPRRGQVKNLKGEKRRDGGGWWSEGSEKDRKKVSVLYILRRECLVSDK